MDSGFEIQCTNCGVVSSIPAGEWTARNRCAGCNSILVRSGSLPKVVSDKDWVEEVLSSTVPVLVWFWGPNCPVCANYQLSVDRFAADFFGLARVVTINAEENRAVAERYGLKGVPTVMIFSGGELIRAMEGPQGERGLRDVLEHLKAIP